MKKNTTERTRINVSLSLATHKLLDTMRKGESWDHFLSILAKRSPTTISTEPSQIVIQKQPIDADLPKCSRRIFLGDQALCVIKPPRAFPLLSLEICRVCKEYIVEPEKNPEKLQETFDRKRNPVTQRNPELEEVGMIYCQNGGLMVFANKCEQCKKFEFTKWYECQKSKYKKKGEAMEQDQDQRKEKTE